MSNVGVGVEVYRTERPRDRSGLARAAVEARGCALNAFWFASHSHSNATMRWGMTARFIEAVVEMHPRMPLMAPKQSFCSATRNVAKGSV
jgi:hypothetical protein